MQAIFDVGSNDGTWVIESAARYSNIMHYAFEPHPKLCEIIRQKAKTLPNNNLEVIQAAVSDVPGKMTFHLSEQGDFGCSSLLDFKPSKELDEKWYAHTTRDHTGNLEVDVIRLDEFIRIKGIQVVEYLHCDAQGMDLAVLRSFGEELQKLIAGVVETALTKKHAIYANQKDCMSQVLAWLEDNKYDVVGIAPNDPWMNEFNIQFCQEQKNVVIDGVEHSAQVGTIGGY